MAKAVRGTRGGRPALEPAEADDGPLAVVGAAAPPGAGARSLQGHIDAANAAGIEGWVWDPQAPATRIRLELAAGDTVLATAVADGDRPGLIDAGIGDGRHAFAIALEPGRLARGRHELHLRCADTGAAVPGSPFVLDVTAAAPAFRWHLDEITDTEASGWIVARNGAARHCVVVLKEGERVLARAVASRFREDLLSAGIGDGCYAFSLEMPRALLDGEEHLLEIIEEASGFALTDEPRRWRSGAGTAGAALTGIRAQPDRPLPRAEAEILRPSAAAGPRAAAHSGTRVLFDISDLVYYLGHHANLTGIQRVQSSIILAMIDGRVIAPERLTFVSFNVRSWGWVSIPTGYFISLLRDLFLPEQQRLIAAPSEGERLARPSSAQLPQWSFLPFAEDARHGILPGAQPFDGAGVLDDGNPSVLCLLGAAWVQQDYFHRVLALKRRFGTRFVMTVHDLIPIYARETCDQETADRFEDFMRRALQHVDHVLAVSENTARDVRRYLATLKLPEPAITVTRNGSSFAEFLDGAAPTATALRDLPERFVLFVATIEGRKNHQLIYDIWQRMVADGDDPPHLICVGRMGWKATPFISALVESDYLDGRVHLLREISDTDLQALYDRCLFTVCPTLYEGWGLPVGESLAQGKICVCSDRASIPEVAGELGVYIDIDNFDQSLRVIRDLIRDDATRRRLEARIRKEYAPITWASVAGRVAAACEAAVATEWREPYPHVALPYATEVSFGKLEQHSTGTGEALLGRILDARRAQFTHDLLDQQGFLLGEAMRNAGSWSQPEPWGTWLCHGGGDVEFGLAPDTSQYYYVFLRLRICEPMQDAPVRLLVNGERLWTGKLSPQPRNLVLRVRKRTENARGWRMRVAVEVDVAVENIQRIAALDGRIPTIGFERLIVVPENDVRTRLDVLTKFVM